MRDKLILGIIAISVVILSSFFVMAVVFNQDSEKVIKDSSQKQTSLKLIEENNNEIEEGYEFEDDDSFEDTNEKEDIAISGNALEKASSVALKYIGEGKVTDSEIEDEEGYYEIEITLDNGNQVDVHLDKDFNILSMEYESEDEED